MNGENALRAILLAHAGTAAIVAGRIYAQRLPQNPVLPAITYERVAGPRVYSHSGPSGLGYPQFQINCWAVQTGAVSGYNLMKQLAKQVRLALDGVKGTFAGVEVQGIHVVNDQDDQNPDRAFERSILTAVVWHDEGL